MKKEIRLRGMRGAIQVEKNSKNEILSKTIRLLQENISVSKLKSLNIVAFFFTAPGELNSELSAYALRHMGLNSVPALWAKEIEVPGAREKVIRILVQIHSDLRSKHIRHRHPGITEILRPGPSGE